MPLPFSEHRARARSGRLLLLFALLFPMVSAGTLRADDTVRRAQEELRKRNLYFGDINGTPNRGTVGALKRFQDRKRLAVTGEVDGETLRCLGIPAPHTEGAAAAPLEPDPWPDMPVLRSDQGRRPPPLAGEAIMAEETITDPAEGDEPVVGSGKWASSQRGAPMPSAGVRIAALSSPGAAASPAPPNELLLTPEIARSYLESYLRDGSANELRAEMSYYASEVDYFNKGPAVRDYIRRDVSNYYKRWPERHYEILGPVTVSPGVRPGETVVRFLLHYRCRSSGHQAEGRTENRFTLQGIPPGDMHIVGMKEQRVR